MTATLWVMDRQKGYGVWIMGEIEDFSPEHGSFLAKGMGCKRVWVNTGMVYYRVDCIRLMTYVLA